MDCPACGAEMLAFAVPSAYRKYLPGDEPGAAVCTRCLALQPVANPPDGVPDLSAISDAIPDEPDAAVPLAIALGLLDSLALYRTEIGDLLAEVERAGVDPLLVLDRLSVDPDVDAAADLDRRRHQLEQLL